MKSNSKQSMSEGQMVNSLSTELNVASWHSVPQ